MIEVYNKKVITLTINESVIKKSIRKVVDKFGGTYPNNYTSSKDRLIDELNIVIVKILKDSLKRFLEEACL